MLCEKASDESSQELVEEELKRPGSATVRIVCLKIPGSMRV